MTLAKDSFVPFTGKADGPQPVKFDIDKADTSHLVLRGIITVQGVPVDVEWLRQHHASARTVLVRIPTSWHEAWGENITLPVPFAECTMEQLVDAVRAFFPHEDCLLPCPKCGAMTWNRKHYPSEYRDANCSPCWFAAFNAQWAKHAEKEVAKQQKYEEKMKAKGYTHKMVAWVHPEHGDDYKVECYSIGVMADAEIQKMLKKRRSTVLTDFKQSTL